MEEANTTVVLVVLLSTPPLAAIVAETVVSSKAMVADCTATSPRTCVTVNRGVSKDSAFDNVPGRTPAVIDAVLEPR